MTRLAVARETHAAACRAAWAGFLEGEGGDMGWGGVGGRLRSALVIWGVG
jgi:hypothetical protein